ncbi:MAG: tRNA pseudouridine32 synthase/23S rRNA pseudouridine746 synthase [Paracoccaceae bacterium]|jgi:tRNA pseudouridine32 synthase/23S rRNA pseudouridine746 synthase
MSARLVPPPELGPIPPRIYAPPADLRVVHRDADVLIVDKPAGLLSVPGNGAGMDDCVESRARLIDPAARIVHRLDLDTSGVMVLALNPSALRHLGMQFERRHVRKTYEARVYGRMAVSAGRMRLALRGDWPNRPRQIADETLGKPAVTDWEVMWREPDATRVRLKPYTGRTHQLRVHMLWLGHPILGDPLYATGAALAGAAGLQLHAAALALRRPADGRIARYQAPAPF